ncbi:MAG TPA: nucleoside recognition domain-containing protein [Candidatus Saccharimonadales bacterium]|nr:nucleoside recognition domain-containing protein [Candidatus Saccharimonadales bacterium]
MLNYIWLGLVVAAVLLGGWNNHLDEVVKNAFDLAKAAVMDIALPLSAIMTVWLGVMRLAEKSGLVFLLARALRPVLRWLFPEVPPDHPAMGSMVMNIAANMLGLLNAATPLGLRAMADLQKLNPIPGTATNAMCTFLTVNTASIQLIPVTAIAILAAAGGNNPTAIIGTSIVATVIAQITGLTAVKILEKLPVFRPQSGAVVESEKPAPETSPLPGASDASPPSPLSVGRRIVLLVFFGFFVIFFVKLIAPAEAGLPSVGIFTRIVKAISIIAIPFFLSFFPLYAALHRIKVYEEFVEGAKEGFAVAIRIIPFLVTILTAVGMFRGAHGIELLARWFKPFLDFVGFPPELLSLALMRPLSGSGSVALVSDVVKTYGPNHIYSMMAGTILGSSETTFYVIAVYFGSVGIRRTRHAVPAGLLADLASLIASVAICRLVFSHL